MIVRVLLSVGALCLCGGAGDVRGQDAGEAQSEERVRSDGVTEYGRKVPLAIQRYLREAYGEELEAKNRWELVEQLTVVASEIMTWDGQGDAAPIDFGLIAQPEEGREAERELALAALEMYEKRGLFDLMDELTRARHVARPAQEGRIADWVLPEYGAARWATRAATARMHLAREAEDADLLIRTFEQLMALGRVMSHEATLLGQLVSTAIIISACHGMADYVRTHELAAVRLRALRDAMERQQPLLPLSLKIEGDRLMALDSVSAIYTDPEKTPLQGIVDFVQKYRPEFDFEVGEREERLFEAWWGAVPTQEETLDLLEDYLGRARELALDPDHTSLAAARELIEDIGQIPRRFVIVAELMPAVPRGVHDRLLSETMIAGHRILLAVELFRAERGQYPDSLEELVPDYLAELPRDPFSGESFIYRRLATGDDEHGRGYLLYSVGPDGVDHGGRVHEDGAAAAFGAQSKGFDLVINAPDR